MDDVFGLDDGDRNSDIFGNHIIIVQQAASHALTTVRVTVHHLVGCLKVRTGDFLAGSHSWSDFKIEMTGTSVLGREWVWG